LKRGRVGWVLSIDHYSVLVGQPGQDAFITGDMVHSPIQGKYPELGMRADYDSRLAGQTRRNVFDRFCDTSTIMCVVHLPLAIDWARTALGRWLQIRRVNRKSALRHEHRVQDLRR
jgi:hypothetical protein